MIHRKYLEIINKRLIHEPRRFIQVISGPRQIGKTTTIRQFEKSSSIPVHFVNADAVSAEGESWISTQWETARVKLYREHAPEAILIIDEIQKLENWSERVKKEWDDDTRNGIDLKVVLLGSSRLLVKQGLTESLAGRFESIAMGHWSFSEMEEGFGVTPEEYVWYGGYPGPAEFISEPARWKNYILESLVETTVSKDILMLTRVDKPALLRNLFDLGCSYSAQILSFNKILGQFHDAGNTVTLSKYLEQLDSAGLLAGLSKFSPDKIRQRSSSPKFQVYNNALMSALARRDFEGVRADPSSWGRWVESAVGSHLLNQAKLHNLEVWYWRHRNDEIDFVLTDKDYTIAFEVKSGRARPSSGMDAFRKRFKPQKVLLIGDSGLPWQEFLRMDVNGLFA